MIKGSTYRKIGNKTETGLVNNIKRKIEVCIRVESIEYDGEGEVIRLSGKNCVESKWLRLG